MDARKLIDPNGALDATNGFYLGDVGKTPSAASHGQKGLNFVFAEAGVPKAMNAAGTTVTFVTKSSAGAMALNASSLTLLATPAVGGTFNGACQVVVGACAAMTIDTKSNGGVAGCQYTLVDVVAALKHIGALTA